MENADAGKKSQAFGIKLAIFLFMCIVFLQSASASVKINEIMPYGTEWVEVYNNEKEILDLSEWHIKDNSSNNPDTITCYQDESCSLITDAQYFLIIGRDTAITQITDKPVSYFYVDDQKIGNGLNDGGDALSFYKNGSSSLVEYSSYSETDKSWGEDNGDWKACTPTPGKENDCSTEEPPEENITESTENETEENAAENDTIGEDAANESSEINVVSNIDSTSENNESVQETAEKSKPVDYDSESPPSFSMSKEDGDSNPITGEIVSQKDEKIRKISIYLFTGTLVAAALYLAKLRFWS